MILFSKSTIVGNEEKYIKKAILSGRLAGDNEFTKKCQEWLEEKTRAKKALLTTSCTHSLELAAILIDTKEGDEIIMPSYTFVSTANAFVLRGAKIVFVDIRPDTMNLDEKLIERAITKKTKAIVPVHYAGIGCDMNYIMKIANKHSLFVIEDAAQGVLSKYEKRYLGSIGHIGAYSFHDTKNFTCGEGGAILFNDSKFIERAEIIRDKGTNRTKFFRGEVDKYSWQDIGSSYLPSELNAAFLFAQLERAEEINKERFRAWSIYHENLEHLEEKGFIKRPVIPNECQHNAHVYYVKVKDIETRSNLMKFLRENGICAVFHYVPLHNSKAGMKYGRFYGEDKFTTKESERILRLPLYYKMENNDVEKVCSKIELFYRSH